MGEKAFVVLYLLTVSSMLVLPALAEPKPVYTASGKVLIHVYSPLDPTNAMSIDGDWSLRVKDYDPVTSKGDVDFQLIYEEINPDGSLDHFMITPVGATYVYLQPELAHCSLFGGFSIDKLAVQPYGSEGWIRNYAYLIGTVDITPFTLLLDDAWLGDLPHSTWHFIGSTTSINVK